MTAEQIQQIREKYKNPLYMKQAINSVADKFADEYIKQEMNIEVNGGKLKLLKKIMNCIFVFCNKDEE